MVGNEGKRWLFGVVAAVGVILAMLGYAYWTLVYVDESNLLTFLSPEGIRSFTVLDSRKTTVWFIEAPSPERLSAIRYGEVPPGFVQRLPTVGTRPRAFVRDEVLTLRAEAVTRYQEHQCTANGEASVSCGFYVQSPTARTSPR